MLEEEEEEGAGGGISIGSGLSMSEWLEASLSNADVSYSCSLGKDSGKKMLLRQNVATSTNCTFEDIAISLRHMMSELKA